MTGIAHRSPQIAEATVAIGVAMAMLYFLRGVLIPLVLAFVLAILVDGLVRLVAKHVPRSPHWAVLALAALTVFAGTVGTAVVISQGAVQIVKDVPLLIDRIDQILLNAGRLLGLHRPLHLETLIGEVEVPALVAKAAGVLGGFLSGFLLTITYFGFILAGRPAAQRRLKRLSSSNKVPGQLEPAVAHIAMDVETYVWVQTVTGLMIAVASALVMFAVGMPNVMFWAILLLLLSYIPTLGVTVGSIIPSLIALLQFPSWWQGTAVFVGIQVIAFIVGNFIYPRMQAETQNINPVATLLSLAFWGSIWGLAGAFLSVPLTLIVMMVCVKFPGTRWVAVLLSNDGDPAWPGSGELLGREP